MTNANSVSAESVDDGVLVSTARRDYRRDEFLGFVVSGLEREAQLLRAEMSRLAARLDTHVEEERPVLAGIDRRLLLIERGLRDLADPLRLYRQVTGTGRTLRAFGVLVVALAAFVGAWETLRRWLNW